MSAVRIFFNLIHLVKQSSHTIGCLNRLGIFSLKCIIFLSKLLEWMRASFGVNQITLYHYYGNLIIS